MLNTNNAYFKNKMLNYILYLIDGLNLIPNVLTTFKHFSLILQIKFKLKAVLILVIVIKVLK